jgi:mannosyltransferase
MLSEIEVIAPNFKRRISGVTATIVRLVPHQARLINIVTTGPGLPPDLPHLPLWRVALLPNTRWRVFHARRNLEMLVGVALRGLLGRKLRLVYTSAEQRDHGALTHWLVSQMDAVVAITPKIAPFVRRPVQIIPHGVDTGVFIPGDRAAARRRFGLAEKATILGCFGRIRAEKGVDLAIDAALALMPSRPDLHLVFAGKVTDKERGFFADQQARIAAAGLTDRIHFLGEKDWAEMVPLYQSLDLFLAPGRREGFGLTPLEAMACNVPCVAADVGAYDTMISPGCGSLVPPDVPAALTRAVAEWVDDPARRAATTARAEVVANHALEREAEALVTLYRQLIGQKL